MQGYTISSDPVVMGSSKQRYVLTIRDLPVDQKPKEKLLASGAHNLKPQELLAIILNQGTKKEGVLEMVDRIMSEYGEKHLFTSQDPAALSENLSIPLGKAMQIVAVGELGRRFFRSQNEGRTTIRTAKDVFLHTQDMHQLKKEHLRGLYINTHYQIIHDEVISIGTVNANLIHPREVFRPAIAAGAIGVVLVHNHPSGITTPSKQDKAATRQLKQAGEVVGIELIDHVIVASGEYSSVLFDQ